MLQWGDLFTARQKIALFKIGQLLASIDVIARPLLLAFGKLADLSNDACPWEPSAECPRNVLSNGRIKPPWDFAEGVPTSESSGSFAMCVSNLASGVDSVTGVSYAANCQLAAAQSSPLPNESATSGSPIHHITMPFLTPNSRISSSFGIAGYSQARFSVIPSTRRIH